MLERIKSFKNSYLGNEYVVCGLGIITVIAITMGCVFASMPEQSIFHSARRNIDINCWNIDKSLALGLTATIAGITGIAALAGLHTLVSKKYNGTKVIVKTSRNQAIEERAEASEYRINSMILGVATTITLVGVTILVLTVMYRGFAFNDKCPDELYGFESEQFSLWKWQIDSNLEKCFKNILPLSISLQVAGFLLCALGSAISYYRKRKILESQVPVEKVDL